MTADGSTISIIIPARNEAPSLAKLLPQLRQYYPAAEMVIVDDGSTDATSTICRENGIQPIQHPYGMGNGAAIKTGVRHARRDVLVFMDADGQHSPEDVARLLAGLEGGYAMAVGARSGKSQAGLGRRLANSLYNRLASWMVGQRVADLTSGFRAAKADCFREFLHLLPNGFSYPTTITISFFRAGYPVAYVPIHAQRRVGKSHINPLRDGVRFFLIIFKISTLYSPLKVFFPISLLFALVASGYYAYTFFTAGRFTNMSALLLSTSVVVFLIGLVSEQITSLLYSRVGKS
jgi:glycosyltransferase involved in cell wall biosynthesis